MRSGIKKRQRRATVPASEDSNIAGAVFPVDPFAASTNGQETPYEPTPRPVLKNVAATSSLASSRAADTSGAAELTSAENPPIAVPPAVRTVGGTIAWISGSVAGIGAIFYAFGYLITLANLNMLGLDRLALRYDPTFYIERGASFTLIVAMDVMWSIVWYLGPVTIVCLGVFYGFRGLIKTWIPLQALSSYLIKYPLAWRIVAYLLLLCLLCGISVPMHFWSPEEIKISGVLYSSVDAPFGGERFSELVYGQVAIGILLLLACALTRAWRWGLLTTAPFAAVFLISIVWLPFEYGKLELPNKFPQVLIQLKQPSESGLIIPGTVYLLNKTDTEFVLWDPRERRVIWVPSETLASAEILESRTLSEIIRSSANGGY